MIDFISAISNAGIVLFYLKLMSRQSEREKIDSQRLEIVNCYIKDEIVKRKQKDTSKSILISNFKLFCKINSTLGIFFFIAHNKNYELPYVDDLLQFFSHSFVNYYHLEDKKSNPALFYEPLISSTSVDYHEILQEKIKILLTNSYSQKKPAAMKSFTESHKSQKTMVNTTEGESFKQKAKKQNKSSNKIHKSMESNIELDSSSFSAVNGNKKGSRNWDDATKYSKIQMEALNFCDAIPSDTNDERIVKAADQNLVETSSGKKEAVVSLLNDLELLRPSDFGRKGNSKSFFSSFLPNSLLNRELDDKSLKEPLEKLRRRLVEQNVAQEVAEQLVDSVLEELRGQKPATFTSIFAIVRQTLHKQCTSIIEGGEKISILAEAKQRKTELLNSTSQTMLLPYSVVFCGVNGVGKSTNLAKVAAWLMKNNMHVLIAACDTFRSGAIEQLNTHIKKLRNHAQEENWPITAEEDRPSLSLFSKGYGKDAAEIAKEAISFAKLKGFDVVLVDTAGRMQDNAPLMNSLAKLIQTNKPDRVLFVGEALVGNEAVDQISKFDSALSQSSMGQNKGKIDGIILTKFDTVDQKVGAALSMTFVTGKPIVFVGVGQNYGDLKKLDSSSVVDSLLMS